MKNKIISGLLLFTFFVLLTPRDWWHDCDHKQISSTSNLSESHYDDGSCNICDIHLGFFTVQSILFYRLENSKHPSVDAVDLIDRSSTSFTSFSLRGPPQNT